MTPQPALVSPIFGQCSKPVSCGLGLTLGKGLVYPEVNYTLPPFRISEETLPEVRSQFKEMVSSILARSRELKVPGLVLEFEQPFELTLNAEWGAQITADHKALMKAFHEESGIPCALRVTIADIRDKTRPPRMRSGAELQQMLTAFRRCAESGADILSIESTGGKEITDEALTEGDLRGVMFGMGVLACEDMKQLWKSIVQICKETGAVAGSDSACGFANTAMRLADMAYIPKVFAALVRAGSAARSLVAFEQGAVGPSKDCAYEGIYLKALLGIPIALEGKSASCAHFSHIGNIASAYADLWSNESVQNTKLLSGYAPEVCAEMLAYDCRLMNEATRRGEAPRLREWLVDSDAGLDPQAYVLRPELVMAVAEVLREQSTGYARSRMSAITAADFLAKGVKAGALSLSKREQGWLDRLRGELEDFPDNEEAFIRQSLPLYRDRFLPAEYGLV